MSKFTFSDLFCGVGMNSVAFCLAGLEPVFASDIDPSAREVYGDNLGLEPSGDMALVDPRIVPGHDVCVASPPCQPHSTAGERKGLDDGRSGTLYSLLRFVAAKRPRVVVVENVGEMGGGAAFRLLRNGFRGLRYRVSWRKLKASEAGAAQTRERLFVVASLGKKTFDFDALEPGTPGRIVDFLDQEVDEGWLAAAEYETWPKPRVVPPCFMVVGHRVATMRDPRGDPTLPTNHYQYNLIYSSEGLGPTLTTKTNTLFLVEIGVRVRRITLDESRRLMGLPDGFRLGNRNVHETMRLLGNGVYVPLVRRLAEEVVRQLLDGMTPARLGRVRGATPAAPGDAGSGGSRGIGPRRPSSPHPTGR